MQAVLSVNTVSENKGTDYTAFFHILRHVYVGDVTKKMRNFGQRNADNEILATVANELGWSIYDPKQTCLVRQFCLVVDIKVELAAVDIMSGPAVDEPMPARRKATSSPE